jgi:hypothetical protein
VNGITQDLPWEDAIGIAEMLVSLGRAAPPSRWVGALVERAESQAMESLF